MWRRRATKDDAEDDIVFVCWRRATKTTQDEDEDDIVFVGSLDALHRVKSTLSTAEKEALNEVPIFDLSCWTTYAMTTQQQSNGGDTSDSKTTTHAPTKQDIAAKQRIRPCLTAEIYIATTCIACSLLEN